VQIESAFSDSRTRAADGMQHNSGSTSNGPPNA
jgi:hypothetical protein